MISKIFFSVAAVMVMTSAAALASIDTCRVDPQTNSVVIEGSAEPNEQVLLTVIKKGDSADVFLIMWHISIRRKAERTAALDSISKWMRRRYILHTLLHKRRHLHMILCLRATALQKVS